MQIHYNVTGIQRKSLVSAVSQELNTPVKYLGAPTFAYEVGCYHINKAGTLRGPDNLDLEDTLHRKGFDAIEREYEEPDTYELGLGGMGALDDCPDIDQHHPGQYANFNAPITEVMQRQMDEAFEVNRLTIEMPRSALTDAALENLRKLVASKATLIKNAFGTDDLSIIVSEDTVSFPWFTIGMDTEVGKAYTHFVSELCQMARTQHRVSGAEKPVDNDKYAFRCFLLRLGFIGSEYKTERKILLSRLTGSSAFKNPASRSNNDE